jgi:hypothetical protein
VNQEPSLQKRDLPIASFRLTAEARRILAELAVQRGISRTALLEVLLREEAERRGIR